MTVHVEFMGPVKRPNDAGELDMEFADGSTVTDLLLELGYPAVQARHVAVYRDGTRLPHMSLLEHNMALTVTVAMGGG